MGDNPYRSPMPSCEPAPAIVAEFAPLWKRIVSLPMVIFGVGYLFDAPMIAVLLVMMGQWKLGLLASSAALVAGAALTWCGLRLRRVPAHPDQHTCA
jgi:hypothetical protein